MIAIKIAGRVALLVLGFVCAVIASGAEWVARRCAAGAERLST